MIITLDTVTYQEFENEEDTQGQTKEHSVFNIKLTRYPTEEDKKSTGYHPGRALEDIDGPITRYFHL